MIEILRASAGSGKTFNLAKNYIHILLSRKRKKDAYKNILAITFTNKATDEMKRRILRELHQLAADPHKSRFTKFYLPGPDCMQPPVCRDEDELREVALKCLRAILHDYGSFSVSTIDHFFQRAIRSFAREIGSFASYQIELDRDSLLDETVDRLLDNLSESDRDLLDWLCDGAMDKLENGGRYNLAAPLKKMAEQLTGPAHRELVESLGLEEDRIYSKDRIKSLVALCRKTQRDYVSTLSSEATAFLGEMEALDLSDEDFANSFPKYLRAFSLMRSFDGEVKPTLLSRLPNTDKWFAKGKAPKTDISQRLKDIGGRLVDLLSGVAYREYMTALNVLGNLHGLGVAGDLYRELYALMREKNVMSLSETDRLLRDIIAGSDAPFVYEKLGVVFENFLLDEFQDTSLIQWDNISPLLMESVSHASYYNSASGREEAPYNLVVGDVKQSIYRWRGSDWNLLNERIGGQFSAAGAEVVTRSLKENYRSLRNIVDFNNRFFGYAAARLDSKLGDGQETISAIYEPSSLVQHAKSRSLQDGCVTVSFLPKPALLGKVLEAVRQAEAAGAEPGDIAVLVRKNADGAEVARYLMEHGCEVVTDDSLMIRKSPLVRRIVATLGLIARKDLKVNSYLSGLPEFAQPGHLSGRSLMDLCYSLVQEIQSKDPAAFEGQALFVSSFLDRVKDFESSGGNNLPAFLEQWKENADSVSSSESETAIRIITVHKSKGLEFPHVVYYYPSQRFELSFRPEALFWCRPDSEGTALDELKDGIYNINLSSKVSPNSMFASDYARQRRMLFTDVINVFYVAFTRASRSLHIVAAEVKEFSFAAMLESFVREADSGFTPLGPRVDAAGAEQERGYRFGTLPSPEPDSKDTGGDLPASLHFDFLTYPLNPGAADAVNYGQEGPDSLEDARIRGRLKFSSDAVDYFSGEVSPKLRGVLLHKLMSMVGTAGDLPAAVRTLAASGELTPDEAERYESFLAEEIRSVEGRGWFSLPPAAVRNEASLICTDGSEQRPDRVLLRPDGSIVIIDYKFGEALKSHHRQVGRYMSLYSAMFPSSTVEGWLWYIREGEEDLFEVVSPV